MNQLLTRLFIAQLTLLLFTFGAQAQLVQIQEKTKIYAEESIASIQLYSLDILDDISIIEVGKEDVVNGKSDYWYKVEKELYNESTWELEKTIGGYVFGHFTSLKVEGQQIVRQVFEGCSMGDCYHLTFTDYDFGGSNNVDPFAYELCLEADEVYGDPAFVGVEMTLFINDLWTHDYEYCNPDNEPKLVKKPAIIMIMLPEEYESPEIMGSGEVECRTIEEDQTNEESEEYSGESDPILHIDCYYKNIYLQKTGYPDQAGRYSYTSDVFLISGEDFLPVTNSQLFNDNQGQLLAKLQSEAEKEYAAMYAFEDARDCLDSPTLPKSPIDQFQLSFENDSVQFTLNLDVPGACMPYGTVDVYIPYAEFDSYLK